MGDIHHSSVRRVVDYGVGLVELFVYIFTRDVIMAIMAALCLM